MRRINQPYTEIYEAFELEVECLGEKHRVRVRGGRLTFLDHRRTDLAFLAAIQHPDGGCAEIFGALQRRDYDRLAAATPAVNIAIQVPGNRQLDRRMERMGQPTLNDWRQEIHHAAHKRRFIPLLAALDDYGLQAQIKIREPGIRPAVTVETLDGTILGKLVNNEWRMDSQQVAMIARTCESHQRPHTFWGESTDRCHVCTRKWAEEEVTASCDPYQWIEEVPGPSQRVERLREHAASVQHLRKIREALEMVLGPGCFPPIAPNPHHPTFQEMTSHAT